MHMTEEYHNYLLPHLSAAISGLYLWCWIQTVGLNLASTCCNYKGRGIINK